MTYRLTVGERIFTITNYSFLFLLALLTFYPFWWIIVTSFSDPALLKTVYFWPQDLWAVNYWFVFTTKGILRAYLISILRVGIAVPAMLAVTGAAAFVLSRKEMMFRKIIISYFFFTMFFSGGLIPHYMTVKTVGLLNTFWVFVIPFLFQVWTMIVMKTSIQSLPDGLVDAALIDGASYMRIFLQIILPLSKAMLAALGLFSAVGWWNDWFYGALYVNSPKLRPLQTFLQLEVLQRSIGMLAMDKFAHSGIPDQLDSTFLAEVRRLTPHSLQLAYIVCATVPILLVYPFLQKYFVKGVLIGSIKE